MDDHRIRIALLLDKAASYDRGLIRGIVKFSKVSSHWEFFLEAPNYTVPNEKKRLMKKIRLWKPDFIIMNDNFLISEFKSLDIPVFITPSNKLIPGLINIIADDQKIGKLGAQYFIEKGFKNFAFYGSDQIFWSKYRRIAFKETIEELNLNYFEIEALLHDNWQNNPEYLVEWLSDLPKPIAIMACSDEFGIHIIESSKLAKIKVPRDIAVLGVDNDMFICDLYDPPMSSIDQNPESVGFEIARNILNLVLKKGTSIENIVGSDFTVITRLSTDILAIEDKEVKKALIFILEKTPLNKITVEDVVQSTFLSCRILEMRFRKLLNRSILEEINRIRMEAICKQLISTSIPLHELADSFGFNSPTSFSNYFKKCKRMTPFEFRKLFFY